jgi:tetratricopeptide (TPR) repeat protein
MNYPGNSSLSPDVHERVLNTYRQTLELASQGNRQEASLGCDFILRLDPEFEPARTLMSRLEQGAGPVAVDDLRPGGPAFQTASGMDETFGELENVDLGLPAGGAVVDRGDEGGGAVELRRLLKERRYREERTQGDATLRDDPEVSAIVRTARSRQEAEPYIQSFLDSARQELRSGNREQAARLLESAQELDPTHPAHADLQRLLDTGGSAAATAASGLGEEIGTTLDSVDLSMETDSAVSLEGVSAGGDDSRIGELLKEGQTAFEQEDYQGAIDAWSRIFLIDIDHQEAARRIEKARRLKAEHERQVEEMFHEGMSALEDGEPDKARELLRRVLSLQPNHLAAQESLQKIEAGEVPSAAPAETQHPPVPATPEAKPPSAPRAASRATPIPPVLSESASPMSEEVLIPPEPGTPPRPVEPWELDVADRSRPNRTFLYIGALVLVAVLVGAWVVYQQWSDWFPNANGGAASAREPDLIRKATSYHELGRTDLAIAQLNRLPPNDPHYEEAQALISQWEAEAGETAQEQPEPSPGGPAATEDDEGDDEGDDTKVRQEDLVAQARQAAARGDYLPAENLLLRARQLGELDADGRSLEVDVQEHLEPLRREIELVRGGDWEFALPDLWRLREGDPENPDINRLLVMSYYNLGVRDLQQGDAAGAVSQFEEAENLLDQPDAELERHLRFARAYQGRSKDLLYQIYVKYLPIRR